MEYLILNAYLKLKKQQKINWKNFLKEMRLLYKILFAMMIVGAIISIISLLYKNQRWHLVMPILGIVLELTSVILLSIFMQKDEIERSSNDIKELDKKYDEIKNWLSEMGYHDKNQIKQLCNRCKNAIDKNEMANEKRKKFIDKITNLIFVPLYASFISKIIGVSGNIDEIIALTIMIGNIVIIIYIAVFGIMEILNPLINSTYIEMDNMLNVIQGMLDRKFQVTDDDI